MKKGYKVSMTQMLIVFFSWAVGQLIISFYSMYGDSYSPFLILAGLFVSATGFNWVHAEKEVPRRRSGIHWKIQIVRAIAMTLIAVVCIEVFIEYNTRGEYIRYLLALIGFQIGTFMLQFDAFYNYHKGYRGWEMILNLGNEAGQDKFFKKIPEGLFIIDIIAFLGGSTAIIIIF
ncbi:MAG: hypothetical protein R3345_15470 [Fulvivirga sp.]|nr:hypothetical protein [Fulvivirga sp.]